MNEHIYGIKASEVASVLAADCDAFVIISDLRIVAEVQRFFGSLAISLFVYRNLSGSQLKKILETRSVLNAAITSDRQTRLNRLYLMQRQYVENIALFDHVILNTTKATDMLRQVRNVVASYRSGKTRAAIRGPVVFLIAAASGAGKRTLMSAMYTLGRRSINVIRKATTRAMHPDDGDEIYQVTDDELATLDIRYRFHETDYGIDTAPIWDSLADGRPQILITNIQQFARFRAIFGDLVVCVYLHATRTRKQLYESQLRRHKDPRKAKMKVREISRIHEDYIRNIPDFHHVLLNTIQREDFWEQMFRLIQHYKP
jgi:guanylate kinase